MTIWIAVLGFVTLLVTALSARSSMWTGRAFWRGALGYILGAALNILIVTSLVRLADRNPVDPRAISTILTFGFCAAASEELVRTLVFRPLRNNRAELSAAGLYWGGTEYILAIGKLTFIAVLPALGHHLGSAFAAALFMQLLGRFSPVNMHALVASNLNSNRYPIWIKAAMNVLIHFAYNVAVFTPLMLGLQPEFEAPAALALSIALGVLLIFRLQTNPQRDVRGDFTAA